MKYFRFTALLAGLLYFTIMACNDPTVIGSELVSGEELDVGFTDTVTFNVSSEIVDTITLYNTSANAIFERFPFGNFQDPIFGRSTSSIYAQVSTSTSGVPDFTGNSLDSVVLVLPYNGGGFYGDTTQAFSLEVFELAESILDSTNFNSAFQVQAGNKIGEATFIPSSDSIAMYVPRLDSTVIFGPQLRVRLDEPFASSLFDADETVFENEDNFDAFFKGFVIVPTSQDAGMVNFKMRDVNSSAGALINVYYNDDEATDTEFFEYQFPIFGAQVVAATYEHDYAGSVAEPFLGENVEVSDSLLFLQSMSGINIVIEFPHLEGLGDVVINEAILEFPILDLVGDNDFFYDPNQLIANEITEDGDVRLIQDVDFAIGSSFTTLFGGIPDDGVYRLNVSAYLQDAKQGVVNNRMEVFISLKPEKAQRVVLAGPKHATNPAKLKLTYTEF